MLSNNKIRYAILFFIALSGIIYLIVNGPISQAQQYHLFADEREMMDIPNFWNVMSNIPLLTIGMFGMLFIIQNNRQSNTRLWLNSFVFFLGIFFTAIGSAWYHLHPSDKTLVWDRLPMTISFMAFFSVIIGKFICARSGARALIPLLLIGFMAIILWQIEGDLRLYALVQFLPMILIPVILLIFKSNGHLKKYFWLMLLAYLIAKSFEASDHFIFEELRFISGHSFKHILAAATPAIYFLILFKDKRKPYSEKLSLSECH